MVKAYNLPFDYVLYEMSYANMVLYSMALPSPRIKKNGEAGGGRREHEVIRVYDKKNRGKLKDFFESID